MATLDVQRKKRSAWPWILLLLVLVAAGVIYYMNRDKITGNSSPPGYIHDSTANNSVPEQEYSQDSAARVP